MLLAAPCWYPAVASRWLEQPGASMDLLGVLQHRREGVAGRVSVLPLCSHGRFSQRVIWPGHQSPVLVPHTSASISLGSTYLTVLCLFFSGRSVGQTTVPMGSVSHQWYSSFPFLTVYFKLHSYSSIITAGPRDFGWCAPNLHLWGVWASQATVLRARS